MTLRVLVTGPSRGIGRSIACLAAQKGAQVELLGRASAALSELQADITRDGGVARVFACDLARRDELDLTLEQLKRKGAPDLIVHNAGMVARARVVEQSDALWDETLEVNLTAPMRITRALLPAMLRRGTGRVVFISSISATLGSVAQSAYNASKAGMVAFMRCLAEELSDTPLMTCALLPGAVDTDMLRGSPFAPRMGPADVAQAALYYGLEAPRAFNGAALEMFGI